MRDQIERKALLVTVTAITCVAAAFLLKFAGWPFDEVVSEEPQTGQAPCCVSKILIYPDSPVLQASLKGDVELLRKLIAEGHEVNVSDWLGWTPLHQAMHLRNREMVEVLLAAGADDEAVNHKDICPPDLAVDEEMKELFKVHGAYQGKKPAEKKK